MTATIKQVKKTIGANLKAIRQRLGLSHLALAEVSSIAKGSIIKMEQGEQGYTIDTLLILISTLGYTLPEIAGEQTTIPEFPKLKAKISQYYSKQGLRPPAALFQQQEKRVKNLVVAQLIPSRFLNKGRHLHEILEYCENEFGVSLKSTSLSNTLKRLAEEGSIDIVHTQSNAFQYRKAKDKK